VLIASSKIGAKSLVTAARLYKKMRGADAFGLPVCDAPLDYRRVKAFKDGIVESIGAGREERWRERGAEFFRGEARFVSPHEVAVGDDLIRADRILITTGSSPAVPPHTGAGGGRLYNQCRGDGPG